MTSELIGGVPITEEDRRRAGDRRRVRELRRSTSKGSPVRLLWLLVGPGILVMLGENDAPSMLSYATAGAQFGIGFFIPFVAVTFGMAYVVQEMTMRVGAATQRGHAELIFDRFGKFWGWFAMGDLLVGNFLTLITEFIGIRAGLAYFGVPAPVAVLGSLVLVGAAVTFGRYWTWERMALGLAAFNLLFVPVAILAHPDPGAIARAVMTFGPLPGGLRPSTVLLLVAAIGATVTPWMLFFQQGAVVDKGLTGADLRHGRFDTALGAVLAFVTAVATILATSVLFGGRDTASLQAAGDFAQAIESHVGHVGASLFALGIFEAGLAAAIMISTSSAYAFGEVTGVARSLNRSVKEARPFYGVLLALAVAAAAFVLIPGLPLVFVVLIVNVVAVLAMPPALVFLYLLANDRELMGRYRNGRVTNLLGGGVIVFLVGAGLTFGLSVLAPGLFAGAH